jgi:hypothetical protein
VREEDAIFPSDRDTNAPPRLISSRYVRGTLPYVVCKSAFNHRGLAVVFAKFADAIALLELEFSGIVGLYDYCDSSEKTMSHPRISIDPAVMMGKPCIKGTRITGSSGSWALAAHLRICSKPTRS